MGKGKVTAPSPTGKDGEEKEDELTPIQPVPFMQLFRFYTTPDILMLSVVCSQPLVDCASPASILRLGI